MTLTAQKIENFIENLIASGEQPGWRGLRAIFGISLAAGIAAAATTTTALNGYDGVKLAFNYVSETVFPSKPAVICNTNGANLRHPMFRQ